MRKTVQSGSGNVTDGLSDIACPWVRDGAFHFSRVDGVIVLGFSRQQPPGHCVDDGRRRVTHRHEHTSSQGGPPLFNQATTEGRIIYLHPDLDVAVLATSGEISRGHKAQVLINDD